MPASKDSLDPQRFLYPLEFLHAEHDHQRIKCAALERLAKDATYAGAREDAKLVLDYLRDELAFHLADEEEDLFPMLRRRALPDDGIEEALALLEHEHREDLESGEMVAGDLQRLADGVPPADATAFAMNAMAFSVTQRRHLAWENGVVLPLAHKRLTEADLIKLGRKMAARRGLSYPG